LSMGDWERGGGGEKIELGELDLPATVKTAGRVPRANATPRPQLSSELLLLSD